MASPPRDYTEPDTDKEREKALPSSLPPPTGLRVVEAAVVDPLQGEGEDFPSEEFLGILRSAVGLEPGAGGRYWHGPGLVAHVRRWRADLGLQPVQNIDAARMSRGKHPTAPNGPKALDGWMAAARTALVGAALVGGARPAPVNGREHAITFWAQAIMGGGYVHLPSVSPDRAREMLERGLVTPEALRAAGVAA